METKHRPESRIQGVPGALGQTGRFFWTGLLGVGVLLTTVSPLAVEVTAATPQTTAGAPTFFGGVQVNEPDHDRWVAALAGAGLDSVEVTLYARQQRWDEAELWYDREAPWVVSEIRAAKRAGLHVVLVMRVALEHGLAPNRHLWHGMIWPREEHLDAWFDRYREYVMWGAEIAASEGVDLLAVGNELNSMAATTHIDEMPELYAYWLDSKRVAAVRDDLVQCAAQVMADGRGADLVHLDGGRYTDLESMLRDEERVRAAWVRTVLGGAEGELGELNARRARYERFWRRLIADVREAYDGPLTYGANFDQYGEIGFWDDLDYVGVNAYFPIGRYGLETAARVRRMERSWRDVAADLAQLGPYPVVLLELGWTRRLGSTVRPYSYDRVEVLETGAQAGGGDLTCVHWASQPDDASERVAAFQALTNVVEAGAFDALRGFMLWKLTSRREHRAIEPFAVLLQPGSRYDASGWERLESSAEDELDAAYLGVAGQLAASVRRRAADRARLHR